MRTFFLGSIPALATAALVACTSSDASQANGANGTSDGGTTPDADGGPGNGDGDGNGAAKGTPLPATTFLFARDTSTETNTRRHSVIAYDTATGTERVVTDLRGDGSTGWEVSGIAIAPDRTRLAIASLYGPTKEDTDTGLATRRLWSLTTDGTDFQRLTPVVPNQGGGKSGYSIPIDNPVFSRDGSELYYNFGTYWYEGTKLQGGSRTWRVASAANGTTPSQLDTNAPCTVIHPAVRPTTGELVLTHSVCAQGKAGLFLYPANGGEPAPLLEEGSYDFVVGGATVSYPVQLALSTPSWAADGSGFAFTGAIYKDGAWHREAFAYDMNEKTFQEIVVPSTSDSSVENVTVKGDLTALAYCLRSPDPADTSRTVLNVHLVDLTKTPADDKAITTDGKSCAPVW